MKQEPNVNLSWIDLSRFRRTDMRQRQKSEWQNAEPSLPCARRFGVSHSSFRIHPLTTSSEDAWGHANPNVRLFENNAGGSFNHPKMRGDMPTYIFPNDIVQVSLFVSIIRRCVGTCQREAYLRFYDGISFSFNHPKMRGDMPTCRP